MSKRNEPDLFTFVVEGSGVFPFDMLRYDECWPYTANDAALMDTMRGENHGRRRITLQTFGDRFSVRPTARRWESFTWKIVRDDPQLDKFLSAGPRFVTKPVHFDHEYEPGAFGVCKRCGGEKH